MTITLHQGDCLEYMRGMDENSIDTLVTDPPAGIDFMGKNWDDLSDHQAKTERGKIVSDALSTLVELGVLESWEAGFLLFTVDWSSEALRVLKPGAAGLVWSIPRTNDLTQFGLRLAGFQVVDVIAHLFGSGFPKSYNISKGIDKVQGADREKIPATGGLHNNKNLNDDGWSKIGADNPEMDSNNPITPEAQQWDGWGTALKPAREDWILAYKPREGTYVDNALKWGVAGLNIDGGRIGSETIISNGGRKNNMAGDFRDEKSAGMFAGGKQKLGTQHTGRFPANVTHDGSDEVLAEFPETKSGRPRVQKITKDEGKGIALNTLMRHAGYETPGYSDSGSAARFFYCAKPSRAERNKGLEGMEEKVGGGMQVTADQTLLTGSGNIRNNKMQNHHPTVKSIALMEYLIKLTKTPSGGVVFDTFMGSGTTGVACALNGRPFIGCERDPEYFKIAEKRINEARQQMILPLNDIH